jgi:phosphoribosyl-AMP cyclohydrolase
MTTAGQAPDLPVRFGPDGLLPVVIQASDTRAVLMVGFMNAEALAATRQTGRVHFWSRSRQTLWRKGETSGHEQLVDDLYVNCEQNSLLITVRQVGAVCHDGYDTCFYRRLDPDGDLTVVRERSFDPADVYGPAAATGAELAARSREHYEAFAYLRDHDLASESRTSALLRDPSALIAPRIADELRELAGVLDGSHRHASLAADIRLEGSQILYWITLAALHHRIAWDELRPDRALATQSDELPAATLAKLLRAEAKHWAEREAAPIDAARLHAALALVGQALPAGGVTPDELIAADLAALYAKPYMASYTNPP